MKKWIATLGLSAALAVAAPKAEAQPVITGGLVNITVTNLLNNNTILNNNNLSVAAAVQIAANICGVAVNVISTQLANTGAVSCSSATRSVILTRQT